MVGSTISHYKITEKLGEGGMGVVYKAEDTRLERPVALKFLAPHMLRDEEGHKRFRREAKAAAALDHPNICTVYEVDEAEGRIFIVMAFLEGQPLSKRIAQGPLKIEEALSVATQVAEGLEAAHKKEIVHRDIKPDNLMLLEGSRGLVKVMDFGLAQLAGSSKLTRGGTTLGTVSYMSPQQAEGSNVDHRTDIWSLGAVLYEMVSGQPPFRGEFDQAVVFSLMNEQPEPLTAVRTGVPQELERIVNKCLAKSPDERYQGTTDLLVDLQAVQRQLDAARASLAPGVTRAATAAPAGAGKNPWIAAVAVIALLAMGGLAWWWLAGPEESAPAPQYALRQLTRDEGLTTHPALSPDGRLIAYVSDRAGENNLDLWVQQVSGGEPIRITTHPANELHPDFSPDGGSIAFFSWRDDGGVYIVPALGGPVRLLARGGYRPRFSPDGQWISFVRGYGGQNTLYLVRSTGGASRELEVNFSHFMSPIWSPDGEHLIVWGDEEQEARPDAPKHWYIVSIETGAVTKTDAYEVIQQAGLQAFGPAVAWVGDGNRLLFEAGEPRNIWQVSISAGDWKLVPPPRRITAGTGEYWPSASAEGTIAFSTGGGQHTPSDSTARMNIWSLPIDPLSGQVNGELERVTQGDTADVFPTLSANGRRMVYASDRGGTNDIWMKDLQTGEEAPLITTPANERRGLISPDGTRLAFHRVEGGDFSVYVAPVQGGAETKLCDHCRSMLNWTADGSKLVVGDGSPETLSTIDVATGEKTLLAEDPEHHVHDGVFSPDGAWFAFKLVLAVQRQPIFITPVVNGRGASRENWIQITPEQHNMKPQWSPDGNLLYFYARLDDQVCLWAQPLDPTTKRPRGEAFAVQHFHEGKRAPDANFIGYGLGAGRLYLPLSEEQGNIWLAEPLDRP